MRIEPLQPAIPPDAIQAVLSGQEGIDARAQGRIQVELRRARGRGGGCAGQGRSTSPLQSQDPAGPFVWKRSYRISDGDVAYALELASVVTLGVIEGRWKVARTQGMDDGGGVSGGGSGSEVELEVQFSSLDEWNDMRGQLLDLPGVDDVRVGAVSARGCRRFAALSGRRPVSRRRPLGRGLSMTSANGLWLVRNGY